MMCSGRVDLGFILRAFSGGHDGVFIGGCKLDECNYVTHGNYDALSVSHIAKKLMGHMGLNPDRLRIEFMSGGDGNLLAELIDDFTARVKDMGPVGEAEGMDARELASKLAAATRLVPYLRLVERERLRVPVKSKEEYERFWNSDEVNEMFSDLVTDKLAIGRITSLLGDGPLSTSEIAGTLSLKPSEVAKHMNISSRQGLVRYDVDSKRYSLA